MRTRSAAVIAAATLFVAGGAAQAHAAAPARSAGPAAVHVSACQLAPEALEREATFLGWMRALPGTERMEMRFQLRQRLGGAAPTYVESPALTAWRKSRPGVANFEYAQTVNGLAASGSYAARVEFRWLGAAGRTLRTAWRMSPRCSERSPLAGTAVTRASATHGAESGTDLYSLDVTNSTPLDERGLSVSLVIDGQSADSASIDLLPAHQTRTVEVTGNACRHRLVAVIRLQGNPLRSVVTVPCPAVG